MKKALASSVNEAYAVLEEFSAVKVNYMRASADEQRGLISLRNRDCRPDLCVPQWTRHLQTSPDTEAAQTLSLSLLATVKRPGRPCSTSGCRVDVVAPGFCHLRGLARDPAEDAPPQTRSPNNVIRCSMNIDATPRRTITTGTW